MRILHVGKYYPPFRGGMETVLQNVAEGLLDAGCEVSLLTAGWSSVDRTETISGPVTGRRGRLTRAAVQTVVHSQPLTLGLVALLRREVVLWRPDLVQLHLPNPLAAAAWLGLLGTGLPHRPPLTVWYHADITRQRFGRRLLRPLIASCLSDAGGVCVSSESLRRHSPLLQNLPGKVAVIPFGIAAEPWSSVAARRDGPFLFVGRLVAYKGLDVLLRALPAVPEARLVVVGDGPREGDLRALAGELGVASRVEFAGPQTEAGIAHRLGSARALILPSVDSSETFGLVQLEAMAAGVPVVVTDLPTGVPEVGVADETGFVVAPGDPAALAQALGRLQHQPELGRRLGEAGRERFRLRFSRERMIERLVPWYEDILKRSPAREGIA